MQKPDRVLFLFFWINLYKRKYPLLSLWKTANLTLIALKLLNQYPMTKIPSNNTQKNKSSTLSVCLIVKNEEIFLSQCLESIKHAVDEIIIVDTDSTDSTVDVAESFGTKVYHHPWRNSSSEGRNYSLYYATCDWLFQIDADEVLNR